MSSTKRYLMEKENKIEKVEEMVEQYAFEENLFDSNYIFINGKRTSEILDDYRTSLMMMPEDEFIEEYEAMKLTIKEQGKIDES